MPEIMKRKEVARGGLEIVLVEAETEGSIPSGLLCVRASRTALSQLYLLSCQGAGHFGVNSTVLRS